VKEQEKKIWLFGVFTTCPLKVTLESCPFKKFRQLSAINRWSYINGLNVSEIDDYIKLHKGCLFERELTGKKTNRFSDGKIEAKLR